MYYAMPCYNNNTCSALNQIAIPNNPINNKSNHINNYQCIYTPSLPLDASSKATSPASDEKDSKRRKQIHKQDKTFKITKHQTNKQKGSPSTSCVAGLRREGLEQEEAPVGRLVSRCILYYLVHSGSGL